MQYFELTGENLGCKIIGEKASSSYSINRFTDGAKPFGNGAGHEYDTEEIEGGKEYVWECVEDCPVGKIDEQTGELKSGGGIKNPVGGVTSFKKSSSRIDSGYHNADSGGASRFYHQSDWSYEILEQIESADPVRYCAKAGQSERNAGLDEFEQQEVAYSKYRENYKDTKDFVTHYPDGTPRPVNPTKNSHPTCKPISLIKYLSSLLLPPDHYGDNRRILVPFSGVSSEMIGAMLAGWPHITG
ncbi:MAG: hypothetical protein ACTSQZ_05555, partial [Candidatus Thorarchaeota archaeon]